MTFKNEGFRREKEWPVSVHTNNLKYNKLVNRLRTRGYSYEQNGCQNTDNSKINNYCIVEEKKQSLRNYVITNCQLDSAIFHTGFDSDLEATQIGMLHALSCFEFTSISSRFNRLQHHFSPHLLDSV